MAPLVQEEPQPSTSKAAAAAAYEEEETPVVAINPANIMTQMEVVGVQFGNPITFVNPDLLNVFASLGMEEDKLQIKINIPTKNICNKGEKQKEAHAIVVPLDLTLHHNVPFAELPELADRPTIAKVFNLFCLGEMTYQNLSSLERQMLVNKRDVMTLKDLEKILKLFVEGALLNSNSFQDLITLISKIKSFSRYREAILNENILKIQSDIIKVLLDNFRLIRGSDGFTHIMNCIYHTRKVPIRATRRH